MIHGSVEPGFEAVETEFYHNFSRDWDKETTLAKEPAVYEIAVEGHLAPHRLQQFEGLEVTHQSNGETLITGPIPDQAALYGLLNWLRDLGGVLTSVVRLEDSG